MQAACRLCVYALVVEKICVIREHRGDWKNVGHGAGGVQRSKPTVLHRISDPPLASAAATDAVGTTSILHRLPTLVSLAGLYPSL